MTSKDAPRPADGLNEALIDQAVQALLMSARLEGADGLLILDVRVPAGIEGRLGTAARAAAGLHRSIQSGEALSDMEETLEDALRAGDRAGAGQGCERYRAYLARRLKDMLAERDGPARLEALAEDA